MRSALLVTLVVMLGGVSPAAAEAPDAVTLVLEGGQVLEVAAASVQGGYVYVTFSDGRMQAFPVVDVDLVGSGLAPAEDADATDGPAAPARPRGLASATSGSKGIARYEITDADVEHVSRSSGEPAGEDEEESEEGTPGDSSVSLLIQGLRTTPVGGDELAVSGTLVNNGARAVDTIVLEGVAVNQDGDDVGRGSTTIDQVVGAKESIGFSMRFAVSEPASDVRIRATAALADFEFEPVPPPQPGQAAAEGGEAGQ